ncbi:MAG: hypothetical protein AB7V08_15035, partial [Elusimicrobiales bacterium]
MMQKVTLSGIAGAPVDDSLWEILEKNEIEAHDEAERLLLDVLVSLAGVRRTLTMYERKFISEAHEAILGRIDTLGSLAVLPAKNAQMKIAALKEERQKKERAIWSLLQVGELDTA